MESPIMAKSKKATLVKQSKIKPGKNSLESQFAEVSRMVAEARRKVIRTADAMLIDLYWRLGAYISRKIATAEWGDAIVPQLASFLQQKHPDMHGLSDKNLWRMKQFFEAYPEQKKLSTVLREIPWSGHLHILSKTKSIKERDFYLKLAASERWSVRDLESRIDSRLFEKSQSAPKLSTALRVLYPTADSVFRDSYTLDFLGLPEGHSEMDLRKAIVADLKRFILEFGRDFAFVGEEYRLQVGMKDFHVDLLFYHRELQCLVAFDLKIDEFKPEYMGKMSFYLESLDRDVKKLHEKPSIGIILCKGKDSEVVEYALARTTSPAAIADYTTILPGKRLLQEKLHEFFDSSVREMRAPYGEKDG
jgi:predicted nuclease of restriction endonuclease-like (RecB) superfamily